MSTSRVTVVVPTHDHAATLPYSIGSVSAQSLSDIDIVIIGDGVGDDTRDIVRDLRHHDARIRFVDRPKSGRTGEPTRHEVLAGLQTPIVAYHGDDDLMFADHLATMVDLLGNRDFAHSLPAFVDGAGRPRVARIDVSKRAWRQAIYPPLNYGVISLTGVVHTMASYRRLPYGWRATPRGIRTDHYMWQQYFRLPGFTGATSRRATTVKLHAALRSGHTSADRNAEIALWSARVADPAFQARWDEVIAAEVRRSRLRGTVMAAGVRIVRPGGPPAWVSIQTSVLNRARELAPKMRTFTG